MDKREKVARAIAEAMEPISDVRYEGYTGKTREALFKAAEDAIKTVEGFDAEAG